MSQEKPERKWQRVDPETQERLRKAVADGRVEFAPQDTILELRQWVDMVLDCVGHPEALVSDESRLSDFLPFLDEDEGKEEFEDFKKRIGVEIKEETDLIIDIARRVRDRCHAGYAPPTAKKWSE